ncbi:MAG: NAD(P)-dependent oxidoreductase, partial [Lachnospiraceae bacterium]|nr:NAD(P)-dependent oxidoreductase [Lachnospiraceae bacterium]
MINISKKQTSMKMQDAAVRNSNFDEVALGFSEEQAIREAMRCLRCRKHPCMTEGCPVHNNIPEFIAKITECDFEGAYRVLTETSSMPAICSRVCPRYLQCEGNCVRGRNGGQPVAIGALERFVADLHRMNNTDKSETCAAVSSKKVAVIGSGPSGLACAEALADQGFSVTIFEKKNIPGGVLTYGIPEFRLPKEIVEKKIDDLNSKGIEIETGKELGKDFTLDELTEKHGFSAVFVGNGAGKPVSLGIPGQETEGVMTATSFLEKANIEKTLPSAKKIIIVGGGNVAMDVCRCAVRIRDAEKVTVVYRRSPEEMPADPGELKEAIEEGVEVMYLTGPVEAMSSDGKVSGLKCIRMELSVPDASGRRKPVPVNGSEFVLEADLIIEAIGSSSDNECLSGIDLSDNKYIVADPETGATSVNGIFAGGDTMTGPRTVISAMDAG